MKYKNSFFYSLLILLLPFVFSCSSNREKYIDARVTKIISNITFEDENSNLQNKITKIEVEILSGEEKGKTALINQELNPNRIIGVPEEGDRVMLSEQIAEENKPLFQIVDTKRSTNTWIAILFFVLCMGAVGGVTGLIFFGLLAFIFVLLIYIILPLISIGINSVLLTFILAIFISTIINFLIQNSKKKLRISIISNIISILVVAIFAYIFSKFGSFGSFITKETTSTFVQRITPAGFIASSIILTALGGIINVGISTLNLANEVNKNYPKADFNMLMINMIKYSRQQIFINFLFIFTIYIGLAMPVMASKYDTLSLNSFINTDIISFYLIAVSIGGLGIITSSLVTCFFGVQFIIESRKKNKK